MTRLCWVRQGDTHDVSQMRGSGMVCCGFVCRVCARNGRRNLAFGHPRTRRISRVGRVCRGRGYGAGCGRGGRRRQGWRRENLQFEGYRDLDAAALRSIAGWSFTPGTKDGKPVAQEVIVPVGFKLIHDAALKGVRDNLGVCSGITAKPPDGIEPDGVLSHPCAVVHPRLRRSRVNG